MTAAVRVLGWSVVGILLLGILTRLLEGRMTYFPYRELAADPAVLGEPWSDVAVRTADGLDLHAWHITPGQGRPHLADVLFLHGNGGNVSHRLLKIRGLLDEGLGVFIVDWRGYGRSAGRPSDHGLLLDAAAARDSFRRTAAGTGRPRGLFGESIGSLPAVRLAAEGGWDFMILEGSFPGKRAALLRLPVFWPFLPFVSGTLDMGDLPQRVACPTLLLHARDDEVIPYSLGREVERRFGGRARFHTLERGGHNDSFIEDPGFFRAIGNFLQGISG